MMLQEKHSYPTKAITMTQCNQLSFSFGTLGRREVLGRFDGGQISSFGGAGLLMMVEQITGIGRQLAGCFVDHRDPDRIEHTVEQLTLQRLLAMVLGYEDLNDHDRLRFDPLLAAAVGCEDVLGQSRHRQADRGAALAGKSTLNRMELTPIGARRSARYKKIVADRKAIERLLVELFLQAHDAPLDQIILDLDATDVTLHGDQPGKHFHGYYDDYCYLPLYIHCGEHVLCAKLRPSNIDASRGALEEVKRIVEQIREHWPRTHILLRADSGFCRDELMDWCENQDRVDYLFGLARNKRLIRMIGRPMHEVYQQCLTSGQSARQFVELDYRTHKSWSRSRRVVAKAEHLPGVARDKANPRFVVSSLSAETCDARSLYEDHYCQRGEAENRIKECQLDLFGHRLSTTAFRANQLRLWLAAFAYTFSRALIRLALTGTAWARIQTATLREKLLKIGARIRVTARKVWVHLSSSFPDQLIFAQMYDRLQRWLT
jgi:hypothetical protein